MKQDRFTKTMLVLIFLALMMNLFKSTVIGELVYAYTRQMVPVEKIAQRLRKMEYDKHYHKMSCDCSSAFLKTGYTKEIKSSPPVGMSQEPGEATTF
jgi:hypothetical protein